MGRNASLAASFGRIGLLAAAAAFQFPLPVSAADMPETGLLTAYAYLDFAAADGPRSWLDDRHGLGGTGKGRFGNEGGDALRLRPYATEAGLVLQPDFGWALNGLVSVIAQHGQDKAVDVNEAYLRWRPLPLGAVRVTVRAGVFYPPVSLEHGGGEWAVTETVTPSAINSWIGEEVKVGGVEATFSTMIGQHRLSLAGAVFELNDTAGTLLAFRGWALHDEKATLFGFQPLPAMNAFMRNGIQAPRTRPMTDLDHRIGWYGKLVWAPPGPFSIQYFHYDNRANPEMVDAGSQWGWHTRFDHLGATLDLTARTRLTAQAIDGTTVMGYPGAGNVRWIDMRYRSAFLLATRQLAKGAVSGRIEAFDTRNHGSELGSEDDETGWAATAAMRWPLMRHASLLGEALHIDSRRDARLREGVSPHQDQNILRLTLRLRAATPG
jgi:hypothetical protein